MIKKIETLNDFIQGVKELIEMNEDNAYLFTEKSGQRKQMCALLKKAIKDHEKRVQQREADKQLNLFD